MALVADQQVDHRTEGSGIVVRTSALGRATELDVLGREGVRTVVAPSRPDHPAAGRLLSLFRHVSSVRIDLSDHGVTCVVRGIRHRMPVTQPVGLGVALALIARGVPAMVSTAPSVEATS